MKTSDLEYPLPSELIAQEPSKRRDESRLLVYDRSTGEITHTVFRGLPRFLPTNCRFFRNNASVFKARLKGKREGGGLVECLLLESAPGESVPAFCCLLKPGKKLAPGKTFQVGPYEAEVLDRFENGIFIVTFRMDGEPVNVLEVADSEGSMPLPPYIHRNKGTDERLKELDSERYQTVYADRKQFVAAAAPTAGLHFTPDLIEVIRQKGGDFLDLTLHVGLGTFQPISVEELENHEMHEEFYTVPEATIKALRQPAGRPRVMIGTTSVRSSEDCLRNCPRAFSGDWSARSNLFIKPPYEYLATDHLITNFHLPRSTLLCLVAAFIEQEGGDGLKRLKQIYAEAVAQRYRFFSFGDAMLII